MRIVLKAGFDRYSGYGNDAVDLAVALEGDGNDVVPWPTCLLPGLPREFTRLLEKDPSKPPDVLVRFAPPQDLAAWETIARGRPQVAYSMWERFPLLPGDLMVNPRQPQQSLDGWDGLIVTCPMNVEAFRNVYPRGPIEVVPCGIAPEDWPVAARKTDDQLTFVMAGMLNGRKDPFALLNAWREVKREHREFDARLHLHTMAAGLHPKVAGQYPDVTITDRPVSRDALRALYGSAHVMVSVSRGEGNNKPAMEFMATGGTVMASDWSGHQNWLFTEATYPLPGVLAPVDGNPAAQEFRVDQEALKAALLRCWEDRADVQRKGLAAANLIRSAFSWSAVASRFGRVLGGML